MVKRILISCWLFAAPLLSFSMPDYYSVVKTFYQHYSFQTDGSDLLVFAKKADGWHVTQVVLQQTHKVINDQLFWSVSTKNWQPLKDYPAGDPATAEAKCLELLNNPPTEYSTYGYERCRYFGYLGWDADLVQDFTDTPNKNDTLLEGLARAHDFWASRYFWFEKAAYPMPRFADSKAPDRLQEPDDFRVKEMVLHFNKAIGYYKQLQARNPRYVTLLGKPSLKLFNEYFHAFLQLQLCNRDSEAQVFLNQCGLQYDDSLAAANLLNSVAQHGILFTNSDNDTYPLMYLQLQRKLRIDVAVVNAKLMGMPAYLQWLQRKNIVSFVTPVTIFAPRWGDMAMYKGNTNTPELVSSFINSRSTWVKEGNYASQEYQLFTTKRLYFPVEGTSDTMTIKLSNYLLIGDFIQLDIFQQNFNTRPIYYTNARTPLFGWYLQPAGLVYKVGTTKNAMEDFSPMATYLSTQYKAPFKNYKPGSPEYDWYGGMHVSSYLFVLKYYQGKGDAEKVKSLTQECFASFGNKVNFLYDVFGMLRLLNESKQDQLGVMLLNNFIKTVTDKCLHPDGINYLNKQAGKRMLQDARTLILLFKWDVTALDKAIKLLSS